MIFLYRFELLEYDAALVDDAGLVGRGTVINADGVRQVLFTHTNYEQAVTLAADPLRAPFLPNFGTSSTTYTPVRIKHSGLRLDDEEQSGSIDVTLDRGHPVAQLFTFDVPGAQVWLTLAVLDEPVSAPLVVWTGRVRSAEFDEQMCKLSCAPIQDVLKRAGLTKRYPRSCGHQLYDPSSCGISRHSYDPAASYWHYREDGFVTARSADGFVLTVEAAASRPDGFFKDGLVVIDGSYGNQGSDSIQHYPRPTSITSSSALSAQLNAGIRRSVIGHAGGDLELIVPLPPVGVEVGMRVSLYKGCDQSLSMCEADFHNVPRHGGYPFIPLKNIFETGLKT